MEDLPVVLGHVRLEEPLGDALEGIGRAHPGARRPPAVHERLEPLLELLRFRVERLQRAAEREGLREETAHARDDELGAAQGDPVRADEDAQGLPAEGGEALGQLPTEDRTPDGAEDADGDLLREGAGPRASPETGAPQARPPRRPRAPRTRRGPRRRGRASPPTPARARRACGPARRPRRRRTRTRRRESPEIPRRPSSRRSLPSLGRRACREAGRSRRARRARRPPRSRAERRRRPTSRAGRMRGRTWRPAGRRFRGRGWATPLPRRPQRTGWSSRGGASARRGPRRPSRTQPERIFRPNARATRGGPAKRSRFSS